MGQAGQALSRCACRHCRGAVSAIATRASCRRSRPRRRSSSTHRTFIEIENQEALGAGSRRFRAWTRFSSAIQAAKRTKRRIKIARLYGHQKGIEMPAIIVMEKAFHGRTIATLSATGSRKVQAGFEPLVPGFVRVPFNDLAAVRKVAESNRNVVAVLVELIQGEGGINICHADYLHGLREICDANGWLLMLDEVQSGIGRTGKWFAFQHSGVKPDVMTLAKGLASGVPIGACMARGPAAGVFKPGNHGSTFGGNPLACAAALATLDIIEARQTDGERRRDGRLHPRRVRATLAGVAGVTRNSRHGPHDRHRARPRPAASSCKQRARRRAAHQRHQRQRDPPAAAARHQRAKKRRSWWPCSSPLIARFPRAQQPAQPAAKTA